MSAKLWKAAMAGWMLLVVAVPASGATTWQVDDDNCPGPGSGTMPDPFCSIQDGIDASVNGDEVVVAPGTYNETINFNGKAITLRSSDGAEVTTIDATGLHDTVVRCVSGEGPDTILDGFTVTGGVGLGFGGGMVISQSSPTVKNCVFLENRLRPLGPSNCGGGGMHIFQSSSIVANCQFIRNSTVGVLTQCGGAGGGMEILGGSPTITGCTFVANKADSFGGGMCVFSKENPTITNCTFFANQAPFGGGILVFGTGSEKVTNCIMWSNTPDQITEFFSNSPVLFSDVQGGFAGVGNINADPLFVDADGPDNILGTLDDNLRLLPGSPAIDAGDNTAVPADVADLDGDDDISEPTPIDLDGKPRFVDDTDTVDTGNGIPPIVDMGAFEVQPPPIPALSQWGLVVLILLLLTVAKVMTRRRYTNGPLPHPAPISRAASIRGSREPDPKLVRDGSVSCGWVTLFGTVAWSSVAWAQVQVGPQIRIDVGGGTAAANETSIASSNFNSNEIVASWNDWRESPPSASMEDEIIRMGVGVSNDGGATWADQLIRPLNTGTQPSCKGHSPPARG